MLATVSTADVPAAPAVVRALERGSLIGGIVTLAVGALVFAGWAFDFALCARSTRRFPR